MLKATLFTLFVDSNIRPKGILKEPQPVFIWQTSQSIIVIGTYITSCGGSDGCGSCTSRSSSCGLACDIGSGRDWWSWNVTSEGSPTDWLGLALCSLLYSICGWNELETKEQTQTMTNTLFNGQRIASLCSTYAKASTLLVGGVYVAPPPFSWTVECPASKEH